MTFAETLAIVFTPVSGLVVWLWRLGTRVAVLEAYTRVSVLESQVNDMRVNFSRMEAKLDLIADRLHRPDCPV